MIKKRDWLLTGVYLWIACAAGYILYLGGGADRTNSLRGVEMVWLFSLKGECLNRFVQSWPFAGEDFCGATVYVNLGSVAVVFDFVNPSST